MTVNAGQSPPRSKRHLNQQKYGYTEYTVAWTCGQWQNFREQRGHLYLESVRGNRNF